MGNTEGLKEQLDQLYLKINKPEFIKDDPVQFPHRYKKKQDKEIAAFLAATIAWGRRDLIIKSAEKMFAIMGASPHAFVMEGTLQRLNGRGRNIHRTFFEDDLQYFCRGFKACYTKYGSLEALFSVNENIWEGINLFRQSMAKGNRGYYSKHIANPATSSACKRINLALRWLVRQEGPVDLGLWKSIKPASLFIPLDLHVGRTSRHLGLLKRRANDRKSVILLTEKLREFCPEDPCKYDLALFGHSALGGAPGH